MKVLSTKHGKIFSLDRGVSMPKFGRGREFISGSVWETGFAPLSNQSSYNIITKNTNQLTIGICSNFTLSAVYHAVILKDQPYINRAVPGTLY